jgi:uncharacterized membrane protein YeaQ/YmgE (transglycosylase-associated protein family)
MNIASWIIFGVIVGIVSNVLEPERTNILGSIILGVLGAVLGGFLASLLFNLNLTGFSFSSLIFSIISSGVILFGQRFVKDKNEIS